MGRKRTRPAPHPADGIARGALQRAVLGRLLAGDVLTVPVTRRAGVYRPPAGMSASSWRAFQQRLETHGYRLDWAPNDYASGMFDTYRLIRLVNEPESSIIV